MLRPVYAVRTGRVTPADVRAHVLGGVGVVLIVQVIQTAVEEQAVGVVQPAAAGGKVILRAQRLAIQPGVERIARAHRLALEERVQQGLGHVVRDERDLPPDIPRQVHRTVKVGRVRKQQIQLGERLAVRLEADVAAGRVPADGEVQPAGGQGDGAL